MNNNELDKGIESYFDKLNSEEWGIYTPTPGNFPELALDWDYPGMISNAIIDINNESPAFDYQDIFTQLSKLGCTALQLRLFDKVELDTLNSMMEQLNNSVFEYVELIVQYTPSFNEENLINLFKKNLRIRNIIVVDAPKDEEVFFEDSAENISILYSTESVQDKHACGVINPDYFDVNIGLFTEAQKHNTCLNRKIAIDTDGSIKNCPSLPQSYGNIQDTALKDIAKQDTFQKYWNINKDQIEVCKDCEFRYICTDCRAYIENDNNILSKPKKCSYDPYKAEWF